MFPQSVPLVRYFSTVAQSDADSDEHEYSGIWGGEGRVSWNDLDKEFRSVILAEAGAGKSYEMEGRARHIQVQGKPAFFIRIEDIREGFEGAFEVGDHESFEKWLESHEEAWFFLDSVDEARLDNPRAFEKAIKDFSTRIKNARHRAHVCISSRPYAWRACSDRRVVERYLPFSLPDVPCEPDGDGSVDVPPKSAFKIYFLDPLSEMDIRAFAEARETPDIDRLIREVNRINLMPMAGRPFDLDGILSKWITDKTLDGRLELLRHNIGLRLNEIDPDRSQRQPLNREKAMYGARLLAAAVVLTGEPGIRVPDTVQSEKGIDAEVVLSDWEPAEVRALLERALFNDALYGLVRFRHREVRELLAAEWFHEILMNGRSRRAVEDLFIRTQYGVEVITPRLRPILPWLVLFDKSLRDRVARISPEVVVEGGDAAHLPLFERRAILRDIVFRIASNTDGRSARDNDAIARIAQPDLEADVLQLISVHKKNEDALFFLGRLVWQGEMTACVPALSEIASNAGCGLYSRIAAVRAVMACGDADQKNSLWQGLLLSKAPLPRRLLAEIVEHDAAGSSSISILLSLLENLEERKRFETTGLNQALHHFISRARITSTSTETDPVGKLVIGMCKLLDRKPHIEKGDCPISSKFRWLIGLAAHLIERFVLARSPVALCAEVLSILQKIPSARFWGEGDGFGEYRDALGEQVPVWHELNDLLFWKSVEVKRAQLKEKGEAIVDEWLVRWPDPLWSFDSSRFDDVISFISNRDFEDDKLVSLSLACRIFSESGKPSKFLAELNCAVKGNLVLKEKLDSLLNPSNSPELEEILRRDEERKIENTRREVERASTRSKWIQRLRDNPGSVSHPIGLNPGDISRDQALLMQEVERRNNRQAGHVDRARWQALAAEFGEPVSLAYRNAAVSHWRNFMPALRSEGGNTLSIPYSLMFAMAGLEIESNGASDFPQRLTENEVEHACRYLVWELNGLPSWAEKMYLAWPEMVVGRVLKELDWELANTEADKPLHYILRDLVYYAPWLHSALAEHLLHWAEYNHIPNIELARYCVQIAINGDVDIGRIARLAKIKIEEQESAINEAAFWYALWVGMDAAAAIPELEQWLATIEGENASHAAQIFITALLGRRWATSIEGSHRSYCVAAHLKTLYVLMHRYIPREGDIDRVGKGVYSPELRDDAQDARDALFNLLSEIPGKETYLALIDLSHEHPYAASRSWMAIRAYRRAEQDADQEPWLARQVRDFDLYQEKVPESHRQLFDLSVDRLIDMKDWLERGSDSPYKVWQKAGDESEIRNLITSWMNSGAMNRFTCAQESELPNQQRPDIWTQNPRVSSPVPIELKLLDQGWTGPKLCERLRNQLAGDYLREASAGCGIMLLVWQGRSTRSSWMIDDQKVGVSDLEGALKKYWNTMSVNFPRVEAIEVILIDLTARECRSNY